MFSNSILVSFMIFRLHNGGSLAKKFLDRNLRYIPEYKRHRPPRLRSAFFDVVLCIPVTVDTASAIAVNGDTIAGEDEAGMVVLESNWIRILMPIGQIVGEVPDAPPVYNDIFHNGIKFGADTIILTFRKTTLPPLPHSANALRMFGMSSLSLPRG